MSNKASETMAREWLVSLGQLVTANITRHEAEQRIRALVPVLLAEFPDAGCYTSASLRHVARQCKFFPSFAEVCAPLTEWWREHRPLPPLISGPPREAREPYPIQSPPDWARRGPDRTKRPGPALGPRYLTPEQLDIAHGRKRA